MNKTSAANIHPTRALHSRHCEVCGLIGPDVWAFEYDGTDYDLCETCTFEAESGNVDFSELV